VTGPSSKVSRAEVYCGMQKYSALSATG